jgi:hypothetical protein
VLFVHLFPFYSHIKYQKKKEPLSSLAYIIYRKTKEREREYTLYQASRFHFRFAVSILS